MRTRRPAATRSGTRGPLAHWPAFRALPPYLGGKRELAPLVLALILSALGAPARGTRLLDPFCGGGAVALLAKASGSDVTSSDVAERAAVVARSLIANSTVRLSPADALALLADATRLAPSAPTLAGVLPDGQAALLEGAFAAARERSEPMRSLLFHV